MGLSRTKDISFVNFEEDTVQDGHLLKDSTITFRAQIGLSQNLTIQKRVVLDILMMFGEVGGLNDFLALLLQMVFGLFSDQFLIA